MNRAPFRILIAMWWLAWAVFIVPAHTRGAIGVDGRAAAAEPGAGPISFFMSALPPCCQSKSTPDDKSPKPASGCAICLIAANTGTTPDLPPLILAPTSTAIASFPRDAQIASSAFTPVYHGRAPPSLS